MKQELNNSKVYLEQKEIDQLLSEVKETLATEVIKTNKNKSFTTTDLWNIRRSKRGFSRRSTL